MEKRFEIRRKNYKNVHSKATKIMNILYPQIDEPLRRQFMGFKKKEHFGIVSIFYSRDYDEKYRTGKKHSSGFWINDSKKIFSTGKMWGATLLISETDAKILKRVGVDLLKEGWKEMKK